MSEQKYDLIIIGGGPAGVSAGVYAARKKLKTLFLTYDFQSQSAVSDSIENWIGTVAISGQDLTKSLEVHLRAYAGDCVDIKTGIKVTKIEKIDGGFKIFTNDSATYESKTVLITTGSTRRKLDIKGADTFEHKGLTYCATCDAPLFGGQDVAVIGGGNAAFETASQLSAHCKSVTLINRSDKYRADEITVEKVLSKPNVKSITGAIMKEVVGDKFVSGIVYEKDGNTETLPITGIFVEIGLIPSTEYAKNVVETNQIGQILVDPRTQQTETAGIWAAGDCTDGLYHQNNIAAGDAVKALEDIYLYLHTR
jgi:NADH-dependent peroxiredoxin subunit F